MELWAVTDKGVVRRQNQDAYYAQYSEEKKITLLIVCDGMGGAKAGNVASDLTVKVFAEEVLREISSDMTVNKTAEIISRAVKAANSAVFQLGSSDPDCRGMGTTAVAAVILDSDAVVMNIGDSRAYLIRDCEIGQITQDHSVVEDMVRRGDLTREESRLHPNKNLITRAIGTAPDVLEDIFSIPIKTGDIFFLCSDGLTNVVSDEEILTAFKSGDSVENIGKQLFDISISRGAPDNITIVIFKKQ